MSPLSTHKSTCTARQPLAHTLTAPRPCPLQLGREGMDRMESEGGFPGGAGAGAGFGGFPGAGFRNGPVDFAEFFSNFGAFGGFQGFGEAIFETPVQLSFMVGGAVECGERQAGGRAAKHSCACLLTNSRLADCTVPWPGQQSAGAAAACWVHASCSSTSPHLATYLPTYLPS